MSEQVEKSWQDKIPGWQAQRAAWLEAVENYKVARTDFLAETLPSAIEHIDKLIEQACAAGKTSTAVEYCCTRNEYKFFRDLCFALRDHYRGCPTYQEQTELSLQDNSRFDEVNATTIQPTEFSFRLAVGWEMPSIDE